MGSRLATFGREFIGLLLLPEGVLYNTYSLTYVRKSVLYCARIYHRCVMTTVTASEARANLYRLIDEAAASHQPLLISGKRNKVVLVSEEDWEAIQETLFLLSVPGMRESIREGLDTPVEECDEDLDW